MPKSEWVRMACSTDRDREAARSWFGGMDAGLSGPSKASLQTKLSDDSPIKLRALFTREDGTKVELLRTFGRQVTITARPPTTQPWA